MRFYLKSNKATPDDNDIFPLSSGSGSSWTDFQVKWSQIKSAITSAISSTFYNKTETDTLLAGKVDTEAGKGLSSNDYTDADQTIVGGVTAALATKVDKVDGYGLSQNDFTDAKDTKLTGISDGATKTEASTTNGNIKIDGVQTQVYDDSAKADKDALWTDATASGNPVTIKTQSAQAAKSTELSMLPVQDLHGYGKPWVGGAGKNLLPMTVDGIKAANTESTISWDGDVATSVYGVTFTILKDSDGNVSGIKANGTASSTVVFYIGKMNYVANTAMSCNAGVATNNQNIFFRMCGFGKGVYSDVNATSQGQDRQFNVASNGELWGQIRIGTGNSVNNMIFKPYLFLDSNPMTSFEPWENKAAISGRTEANILECGKNMLPMPFSIPNVGDTTTINSVTIEHLANGKIGFGGTASAETWVYINRYDASGAYNFRLPKGSYKLKTNIVNGSNNGYRFQLSVYGNNPYEIKRSYVSINSDVKYFDVEDFENENIYIKIPNGKDMSGIVFEYMVCPVNVPDMEFEPYTEQTITIPFGSTIYGGTLNVETGILSVEWAYIASYNGEAITEPWISDRDEYVPNTTPSTGAEVAYKLASPTTATLTEAQVNLIKGINNISTDADGISITYFADGESLTDADNRITAVLGDFATVEGARASQNYAIGDYLIFSDKFCKASAAIATGEVLAIGTNLTQTTIGAELKAILAQL